MVKGRKREIDLRGSSPTIGEGPVGWVQALDNNRLLHCGQYSASIGASVWDQNPYLYCKAVPWEHDPWLVVQMVQYPRRSVKSTANPVPRESLRYTVTARPADVVIDDLSYPFERFTRATVLNCEVQRVVRNVH
jgi:hypothetical protein